MNLTRFPSLFSLDPFTPMDDGFRPLLRPWRLDVEDTVPQIRLEVRDKGDAYEVAAEMPGVRKEDIDVRLDGRLVNLSAEVRQERSSQPGERELRSERTYGCISRAFTLGSEIDEGRASARYDNGVLQLVLPKKASAESRRLAVN